MGDISDKKNLYKVKYVGGWGFPDTYLILAETVEKAIAEAHLHAPKTSMTPEQALLGCELICNGSHFYEAK